MLFDTRLIPIMRCLVSAWPFRGCRKWSDPRFPKRVGVVVVVAGLGLAWGGTVLAVQQVDSCPVGREMVIKGIELFDLHPDKGMGAVERGYRLCANDLAVGYNHGLALYQVGRREESRKVWAEVLKANPDHLKTLTNLAWVNYELGDDETAHILAFKGLNKFPGNLALAHTKLFALFRLGRYLEAYDWMTRAELSGAQATGWYAQAVGYVVESLWKQYRKGERDLAVSRAVMLVKDYPEDMVLMEAKDRMVRAMVDPDEEIPHPIPLPHEAWAKQGEVDLGQEVLDGWIQVMPGLNRWEKRSDAFALVVGVHNYRHMRNRPFADRDATNFYRMLVRRGGWREDRDHARLRLDVEAGLGTLNEDLAWWLQQGRIHPNAALLFYFAGHAVAWRGEDGSRDWLLLPADARATPVDPGLAISLKRLKQSLDRLPNRELAVILESCFASEAGGECRRSGQVREAAGGGPEEGPEESDLGKGWMVAARQGESAWYPLGRQSALSYFLLKGMLGSADDSPTGNQDGWVDLGEAFAFAQRAVAGFKEVPQVGLTPPSRMRLVKTGGER